MIYLDNAATTFPKPPQVLRAASGVIAKLGANPGRSGHRMSLAAGRDVMLQLHRRAEPGHSRAPAGGRARRSYGARS